MHQQPNSIPYFSIQFGQFSSIIVVLFSLSYKIYRLGHVDFKS